MQRNNAYSILRPYVAPITARACHGDWVSFLVVLARVRAAVPVANNGFSTSFGRAASLVLAVPSSELKLEEGGSCVACLQAARSIAGTELKQAPLGQSSGEVTRSKQATLAATHLPTGLLCLLVDATHGTPRPRL